MKNTLTITFTPHASHGEKISMERAAWILTQVASAPDQIHVPYYEFRVNALDDTKRIGWYVNVETK